MSPRTSTLHATARRIHRRIAEDAIESFVHSRFAEMEAHEAVALARGIARRDGLETLSSALHSLLLLHILGLEEEADEALKAVLQGHRPEAEMLREERVT